MSVLNETSCLTETGSPGFRVNMEERPVVEAKSNFFDLDIDDLESLLTGLGKEKFRAKQIFKWVYSEGVQDFQKMTNLSKAFREELPHIMEFKWPEMISQHKSQDGTRKYLFKIADGLSFETVLIPSKDRWTLCLSSEVGCNLGCRFCYTGKQKLKKRLSPSQIVGQFLMVQKSLPESQKITNVVFMGMGEPLDNEVSVFKAIEILKNPLGIQLSRHKITVSTSGIVPLIPLVARAGVRLAVSLNGANDEVRSEVMPINKRWPIKELLQACETHCTESQDKVTFEYVLLKGVTDSLDAARQLYHLTKKIPCKINIIPFNEHPGSGYYRPSEEQVLKFQKKLIDLGCHVLLRKTMGSDIYAACGQLTSVKS